jgi:hypothetical protein
MLHGWPPSIGWVAIAANFAFWIWLFLLLVAKGIRRYPEMILDATCTGALAAVAVVLYNPGVRQGLAAAGFREAAWVVLVCGSVLVLGKAVQRNQRGRGDPTSDDGGIAHSYRVVAPFQASHTLSGLRREFHAGERLLCEVSGQSDVVMIESGATFYVMDKSLFRACCEPR